MTAPHFPFGTQPDPRQPMSNAQKVSDERLARMTWRNVAPHEIEAVLSELQALRAAPTPDAHSEVGVKALAWEQKSEFWCRAESGMEHLPYTITDGAAYGRHGRRLPRRLALGNVTIETYNNDEEAKIAADAHHRQRILSALTAGVMKAEPVAWSNPKASTSDHEAISAKRAIEQWRASLKRPDLSEEDRVKGAIEAYERQAFALASKPEGERP